MVRNGFIGEIKSIKVNVGPPPVVYDLSEEPVPNGLDWKKWLGPNEFKHFNAELAPPITKMFILTGENTKNSVAAW
jgi:hypothetical protein